MQTTLLWTARLAGLLGILVIVVAVVARILGAYWLAGLQVGTLLQGGMAAALVACLAYMAFLAERPR